MRKSAVALLVLTLASACASNEPESRAVAGTTVSSTSSAPSTSAAPTSVTAPVVTTTVAPVVTTTVAPVVTTTPAPPPESTVPPETTPATIAVPVGTTDLTALPALEDLDEGEHVGIVEAIDGTTIEFDRVEPIDANGDGTFDAYRNENPRQRSVPLPDHVLLDGQVVDRSAAAERLTGLGVLVRLTIVGQRLAAVDQLTVPV